MGLVWVLVSMLAMASVRAQELDPRVRLLEDAAEYGYWAPQIHELYVRVPLKVEPIGGDEQFIPLGVTVDGKPVEYAYWYAGGTTLEYHMPVMHASELKIEVFIPVVWHAGERHTVALRYAYGGKDGTQQVTFPTPNGGAWAEAIGGDYAFMVREEAGLAREKELVEVDITVPRATFPDPEHGIRATLMRAPGVFEEIPCQVYDAEPFTHKDGRYAWANIIRFRVAVQLSLPPKGQALVHLWSCPPREPAPGAVRLNGNALGGTVENTDYTIKLDTQSGQLFTWYDKRLDMRFEYVDPRLEKNENAQVMHRTPDVYPYDPWSHAFDWRNPVNRTIAGPVFCETLRWGDMPGVPQVFARVSYRFVAGRPEVRVASSMRVKVDLMVMGLRMGNLIFTPSLFTHAAWPRQDGTIVRVAVPDVLGNDMGAPPISRFPVNTPWVAFYNLKKKIGFALMTVDYVYFSESAEHPNQSRATGYVSNYRNISVYCTRAATQTYCANVHTYATPLSAGTIMYEDVAFLPFTFKAENDTQFQPIIQRLDELKHPLVVVP